MKFAFEVPTPHLQDFHDLQDFYFILTLQMEDEVFERYMEKVMVHGLHSIWVDNSFNETQEATHHHDLLEVYNTLRAQKLIPPDATSWTPKEIVAQVSEVNRHGIPYWKMSIVTHSFNVLTEVRKQFYAATNVSIPYMTRPRWEHEELAWAHKNFNIHYLGLNNIKELVRYEPLSCDTGMPVKLALQDKTLDQWIEEDCPHIYNKDLGSQGQDYFNAKLTKEQIDLARRNICQLKEEANITNTTK